MATAGSIVIDLLMRTGMFETDSKRAEKRLRDMQKTAVSAGKALGTAIATGVGVAVGALTVLTTQAINNADSIRDMSIQLGVSTETLSSYGYAATQTGTDLETLGRGLKILTKNVTDALDPTSQQAKIFDTLGISVTDAQGKLRSLDSLVPQIADKFKGLEDGTLKTSLAMELFGAKSGTALIEFFNQGSDGLDEIITKFRALGGVIDQDTADKADQFNDTLGDLKTIAAGLGLTFAKELLPYLIKAAESLKNLANDGKLAGNAATVLGKALQFTIGIFDAYNNAVDRTSISIGVLASSYQGFQEIQKNLSIGGLFNEGSVSGGIKKITDAFDQGQKELDSIIKRQNSPFKGVSARVLPSTSEGSPTDTAALQRALGGAKTPKGSSSGSKSDAEREAERLKQSYEDLKASLLEQIALTGDVTEVERLRYDLANGEMKNLSEGQKQELLGLQQTAEFRQQDYDLLQKQVEAEKDRQKAIDDGVAQTDELIADMELELSLIGMSNEARAQAIALRYADADATEEQRSRIAELAVELERTQTTADFFNDTWSDIGDAFVDVASRSKTGLEAVGDVLDNLYKRALQFVADQAIQALLGGASGGAGGGASAGSLMDLFSGAFMGSMAGGGSLTANNAFLVGEQGPELFVPRTAGAILPANETAMRIGGRTAGGSSVTNIFVQPTTTRRTADQIAQANDRKQRQASLRNK